ncbi:MAG: radical SAM family heme chaperone HemW [Sediminibacterium magnilacihabitans]|jgi:oxygen-independent coproporphyrinogen-3 oxidase|nr:radical SAM family heme chaperone HemW [Sediminibacterium magnilacihabitans]
MAGIYIHIPFCRKACHYCNFHFSTSLKQMPAMVSAIEQEILMRCRYLNGEKIDTIYFGGGTPSLLPEAAIASLLTYLDFLFQVDENAEITLEANPDDISKTKLKAWKRAGFNRLSIGVQSFSDSSLQWMNRAHHSAQSVEAVELAQAIGFSNISIDLIYGVPGMSDADWEQDVHKAIALQVPHLSCYALTVEPRTALDKMIRTKKSVDIDADTQARQFSILTQKLAEAGFEHYEISNFAKPGFRSRHNSSYWQGTPYLGLGPSAHSFNGTSRQWNTSNNALYLSCIKEEIVPCEQEILSSVQQLNEYIMTSLRTIEGIDLNRVATRWGNAQMDALLLTAGKYLESGRLTQIDQRLQLTEEGKFLADGIAADLFSA